MYCRKGLYPQAPSLPPTLKAISYNSKKQSREDKAEEMGEEEESFGLLLRELVSHATSDLQGRGVVLASDIPLYWGETAGILYPEENLEAATLTPKVSGEEPTRARRSWQVLQLLF